MNTAFAQTLSYIFVDNALVRKAGRMNIPDV